MWCPYSEIARAVGAAVSLEAIASNKASPSGLSALLCLPELGGTEPSELLQLAEDCIRQMQYDPFVPGSGLRISG